MQGDSTEAVNTRDPQVLKPCAKCGHTNPHGANTCTKCGAHLFLACRKCGHGNERRAKYCAACGSRLHRPWWLRLRRRLFQRTTLAEVTIYAAALLVLVAVVWMMSGRLLRPGPPPEPTIQE